MKSQGKIEAAILKAIQAEAEAAKAECKAQLRAIGSDPARRALFVKRYFAGVLTEEQIQKVFENPDRLVDHLDALWARFLELKKPGPVDPARN